MIKTYHRNTALPILIAFFAVAMFSTGAVAAQTQEAESRVAPGVSTQPQATESETAMSSFAFRLSSPICAVCEVGDACGAGVVGCCLAQITICPEPEPGTRGGADGPDVPAGIVVGGADGPDPPTGG